MCLHITSDSSYASHNLTFKFPCPHFTLHLFSIKRGNLEFDNLDVILTFLSIITLERDDILLSTSVVEMSETWVAARIVDLLFYAARYNSYGDFQGTAFCLYFQPD